MNSSYDYNFTGTPMVVITTSQSITASQQTPKVSDKANSSYDISRYVPVLSTLSHTKTVISIYIPYISIGVGLTSISFISHESIAIVFVG